MFVASSAIAIGCADSDSPTGSTEPPSAVAPQPALDESDAIAWVPGTAVPRLAHQAGTKHTPAVIDWVPVSSLEEMADDAQLIVHGRVEAIRYDVFRAVPHFKPGARRPPLALEGKIHHDDPITIATIRLDRVVQASPDMKTPANAPATAGTTVDVLFMGGLLTDGCTTEPDDNPLPAVGDEAVYFLHPLGGDGTLGTPSTLGLYGIAGGVQGRVPIRGGTVVDLAAKVAPLDTVGISQFRGRPVEVLVDALAARNHSNLRVTANEAAGCDSAQGDLAAGDGANGATTSRLAAGEVGNLDGSYLAPTVESSTCYALEHVKWCDSSGDYWDYSSAAWPVNLALRRWAFASPVNAVVLRYDYVWPGDASVYSGNYGNTGWQGITYYASSNGCLIHGRVTVKLNDYWPSGYNNALNHRRTATHEIGHTIGLGHSSCGNEMYYRDGSCQPDGLSACDGAGAHAIYP